MSLVLTIGRFWHSGHTCTTDTTDFRGGVWGFSAAAPTSSAPVVVGPAIQIRWREEDLSILKTHPLTPGLYLVGDTALSQSEATSDSTAGIVIIPISSSSPASIPAPLTTTSAAGAGPTSQAPRPSGGGTTMAPQFDDIPGVRETPLATPDRTSGATSSTAESDDRSSSSSSGSSWAEGVGPVALTASLVGLVAVILAIILIRRYRWKHMEHAGQASTTIGAGDWVAWCRRQAVCIFQAPSKADISPQEKRDAELGIEAPSAAPGATQPYGSSDNPAELDAAEAKPLPPLPPRPRPSWVSRISTRLSLKPRAAAAEGHASVATSRRTTTSSIAAEDYAVEWAAFAKEKWPSGSDTVNGLTCPPPKSTEPPTAVPRIVVEPDTTPSAPKGHARNGSQGLSRLSGRSDGTFGGSPPSPRSPLSPMSFHSPTLTPSPRSPRAFPKDDFP